MVMVMTMPCLCRQSSANRNDLQGPVSPSQLKGRHHCCRCVVPAGCLPSTSLCHTRNSACPAPSCQTLSCHVPPPVLCVPCVPWLYLEVPPVPCAEALPEQCCALLLLLLGEGGGVIRGGGHLSSNVLVRHTLNNTQHTGGTEAGGEDIHMAQREGGGRGRSASGSGHNRALQIGCHHDGR